MIPPKSPGRGRPHRLPPRHPNGGDGGRWVGYPCSESLRLWLGFSRSAPPRRIRLLFNLHRPLPKRLQVQAQRRLPEEQPS